MPVQSAAAGFPTDDPDLPDDVVAYGPDIPDESSLRLLGQVGTKRLLVLGAGGGQAPVALAGQGAHVIVIDGDDRALEVARDRAERLERRLELHHGDVAELAFIRADTIDGAVAVYELGRQSDLDRVLRQVNRVLRTGAALVCSLPHPAFLLLDAQADDPFRVTHAYLDRTPRADGEAVVYPRSVAEIFGCFHRANLRVDALHEPAPVETGPRGPFWSEAMRRVPATLVVRARKDGL
jgi:SAM-dependent methyltransferase